MIKLITQRKAWYKSLPLKENDIEISTPKEFLEWFDNNEDPIQLDTETNIIEGMFGWQGHLKGIGKVFVPDLDEDGNRIPAIRECYVVQVGDKNNTIQWVFDVPGLNSEDLHALDVMFKSDIPKIIHNALFDYTVVAWCFDVRMNKLKDTYLMTEILHAGYEIGLDVQRGYNSLAGLVKQYKGIDVSKEAQTTFTGDPMSIEQLIYAASDVKYLGDIYDELLNKILADGLNNVMALENSLVRAYGNTMLDNFYLDPTEWQVNIDYNLKVKTQAEKDFHSLMREYFEDECKELGLINKQDEYLFNWRSSTKKFSILHHLYPNMPKAYKKVSEYKDYLELIEEDEDNTDENPKYLNWLLDKDYESLEEHLIIKHSKFLEEQEIFIPANKVMINLNSPDQKLSLFKLLDPDITSTGKDIISKINHPLARKIQEYNKASKLHSSYGQNFLDCIDPDGQFRVKGYKQILATGRSAMNHLQLLPGVESFRSPFKPNHPETGTRDDGYVWKIVGADYASQEAAIAAVVCKEDTLVKAIEDGCDFHSTCASLMFPDKWKELGGDPYPKGKPKDKTLLKLRGDSKAVSFGLFYGKSAIGLGDTLQIPATTKDLIDAYPDKYRSFLDNNKEEYEEFYMVNNQGRDTQRSLMDFIKHEHKEGRFMEEVVTADDLIDRFFKTFPNIKRTLADYAITGVNTRRVRTPGPIGRLRYFPKSAVTLSDNEMSSSEEGAIRRRSQNTPIQGCAADMSKYALCILNKYIEDNGLEDRMIISIMVHDEIQCIAREDFAEDAMNLLVDKMEEAARFILGSSLLKSEGAISDCWTK